MRFLHTGDLHLDSSFCASDTFTADARRDEQRRTFGRIFELARAEGCRMVLIAGDLFDSRYVTPETERYVTDVFAKANIPVVIAPGNHDPYVNGSFYKSGRLPENVYVFSSSELQRFDFPELSASVYGYAFTSSALTSSPLAGVSADGGGMNIKLLCAHADLSAPISRYCPLTAGDISGLGITYAALGHIHNRDEDDSAGGSVIRYCGFAEGRSFDELGDGGVYIVDCEPDGEVNYRRFAVSGERYDIRELDLSGCCEREEIVGKIKREAEDVSANKNTHLRLLLTGSVEAEELPDLSELARALTGGRLLSLDIRDMTVPVADISSLRADPSLRGELYRALYSGLVSDDPDTREKTALALQIGLAAIDGRRISGGKESL
ncbi:MAG: DNA repair exonuclease [Clostridia bacterium]|nr:DNA repair exonuclease [Clostridia bacterium]